MNNPTEKPTFKSGFNYIKSLFHFGEDAKANPEAPPRVDSLGRICPAAIIDPVDAARDDLVNDIVEQFKAERKILHEIKVKTWANLDDFVAYAFEQYKVAYGGKKKNNLTLTSYNQLRKVTLTYADIITPNQSLLAAKTLIDEIITEKSEHLDSDTQMLLQSQFYLKSGDINLANLLNLRRQRLKHPKWPHIQELLAEALLPVGAKGYIRVYERESIDKNWESISLDMASL